MDGRITRKKPGGGGGGSRDGGAYPPPPPPPLPTPDICEDQGGEVEEPAERV